MAGLFGRRKAGKEQAPPGKTKKHKAGWGKAAKARTKEEDAFEDDPYMEASQPDADGSADGEDARGGQVTDMVTLTDDELDTMDDDLFSRWDSSPESENDEGFSMDYVLDDDADEGSTLDEDGPYRALSEDGAGGTDEDPFARFDPESKDDTEDAEDPFFRSGPESKDDAEDAEDPFSRFDPESEKDAEDAGDPVPKADAFEAGPDTEDDEGVSPVLSMDELEGNADTGSKGGRTGKKSGKARQKPVKERAPMSEEKRQFIFTAGLATAAICSIVFVLFGAVFAYRMFRPQLSNAYAWQGGGDGNVYYDSGGRMHVNVYVTKTPDTEIILYMLPDGTVTTEKPADGTPAVPKVFYVDSEGNLSETKPSQADPDDGGSGTDHQPTAEPGSESSEGDGTEEGSSESGDGPVQATPVPGEEDGSGEVQGTSTGGKPQGGATGAAGDGGSGAGEGGGAVSGTPSGGKPAGSGASGSDGTQGGGQQGGGSGDAGEGTGAGSGSADGENGTDGASGTGSGGAVQAGSENPYKGMTEEEILKAAQERRDAGKGMYLDTDKVYRVQAGDTLSKLSGKLGFSVDFLAAYNGLGSKDMIHAGESLRYPSLD